MKTLVLASSSATRKALLERLQLPFCSHHPEIDETPLSNETAIDLVKRLAIAKAHAVAPHYDDALIIGCDQVLQVDQQIMGKPANYANARKQLRSLSGKTVVFYTGMCLLDSQQNSFDYILEPVEVKYRLLSNAMINAYLAKEQPYYCAGSTRIEGLGICLVNSLHCRDPNTLSGLPLIALIDFLQTKGINVLKV